MNTETKEAHTSGPWRTDGREVVGKHGRKELAAVPWIEVATVCTVEDAERIVACVNACEGLSTQWLETGLNDVSGRIANRLKFDQGVLAETISERDAMRAEVARLKEALRECITDDGAICFEHRDYLARRVGSVSDTARAALASKPC